MNESATIQDIRSRLEPNRRAVILAYGSSNTERFLPGMHWFDIVELALRHTYGRFHQCTNTGLCGDTSRGLLERFERDAALFRPRLAIVTIGGNDRDPAKGVPPEQFAQNLTELQKRFASIGCRTIFQTYYSPDPARNDDLTSFHQYMDILRSVARDTGSGLVDHLVRWEAFRQAHGDLYLEMMQDGFHVNHRGNAVLGLDCARAFGAIPAPGDAGFWDQAFEVQREMDSLIKKESRGAQSHSLADGRA